MTTKIDRDYLVADLASVENLIKDLTSSDFVTRLSLESRREELRQSLVSTKATERLYASAALFFSGKPVSGSRGIESDFGANVITSFQDMVSKVSAANRVKPLKRKGIVPQKSESKLHITRIVHGSFGFQFEEINDAGTLIDSSLKQSVDETAKLLSSFDEPNDETFGKAVEDVNARVLGTMRKFFELVQKNQATFRLVCDPIDKKYDESALARAVERAKITGITEETEVISGQLSGVLPERRTFELRTVTHGTVYGKIDPSVPPEDVARMNKLWLEKSSRATMRVRRFTSEGKVYHSVYFLLKLQDKP